MGCNYLNTSYAPTFFTFPPFIIDFVKQQHIPNKTKNYTMKNFNISLPFLLSSCFLFFGSNTVNSQILNDFQTFNRCAIEVTSLDGVEALMRVGEEQMHNRCYEQAVESFTTVLTNDPYNCYALYYLSEINLVRGLEEMGSTYAKSYYQNAVVYSEQAIAINGRDLLGLFYRSLSYLHLGNLARNFDEQQPYYTKSMADINEGLGYNLSDENMWFAYGEWWFYTAQLIPSQRASLLKSIDQQFFDKFPSSDELAYDIALDAFENVTCYNPYAIMGLYGIVKTAIVLENPEKAAEAYRQVRWFNNYNALPYYYVQQIENYWLEYGLDKQDFLDTPVDNGIENLLQP